MEVWCYPAGTWSTWHCKHSRPMLLPSPPGSLFICGHRNVNSLSLSISEMTTVAPTLPHEEVAGPKERQPQLTSTVTTDWTDAWAAKSVFPLQNEVDLRHGVVGRCIVVRCVTAAACQRGTNIRRLARDSKKCLWKIHFHSCSPGHRQRVLFLKHIQWQRTLQSFT